MHCLLRQLIALFTVIHRTLAILILLFCTMSAHAFGPGSFPGGYGYEGPMGNQMWLEQQRLYLLQQQQIQEQQIRDYQRQNERMLEDNEPSAQPAPVNADGSPTDNDIQTAMTTALEIVTLATSMYAIENHCRHAGYTTNGATLRDEWARTNHYTDAHAIYSMMQSRSPAFNEHVSQFAIQTRDSFIQTMSGRETQACADLSPFYHADTFNRHRHNAAGAAAMQRLIAAMGLRDAAATP